MLKIRLQRIGRRNDPAFRVVVIDSHAGPKTGAYLDLLGSYDPRKNKHALKSERIKHWIEKGAQVSDTVHNLLVGEKIIDGKKINVLPKKRPIAKEGENEAASEDGTSLEGKAETSAQKEVKQEGSSKTNGSGAEKENESSSKETEELPAPESNEAENAAPSKEEKK